MIKDINSITPEYMKHRLEEETEQYKQEIERLNNIIKEVREAVETGISEDNYDGCVYDIKNILDKAGSDKE